jgi:hypothetical protein
MAGPEQGESETPAEPGAAKEQPHGMRRRVVGWVMLAAGVLILGSTAWVGWRTYQAYSHLQNAATDVSRLQDDVRNVAAIGQTATAATIEPAAESAGARSAIDEQVFRAATAVPWIGPNLEAVREVTVTVDSLATEVMPSLAQVARTVSPSALAPRHGAIELAPIEQGLGGVAARRPGRSTPRARGWPGSTGRT